MNNHKHSIRSRSVPHLGDIWFLLGVLLLGLGTLAVLPSVGVALQELPAIFSSGTASSGASGTLARSTLLPQPPATFRTAQTHLYLFPSTNTGVMQPSVDMQGHLWVGEMYANRLARLDTHNGVVTTWTPPDGQNGIMSTAIDHRGQVWFVEQGANYIGEFDPRQHVFHVFPLGTVQGRPLGPQDLQFDATGLLWFSAPFASSIGRLDPATGVVHTWSVPSPAPGVLASPFSLTVTRQGQVWFGGLGSGVVGHLNPTTGIVTLFHLTDSQAQVFSMATDSKGRIWFSELLPGQLGMIDPVSGHVSELPVPAVGGNPAVLYELVITPHDDIWFADNTAQALVRYTPATPRYTFFQLSASSGSPYGLTLAPSGSLWFTVSGSSVNAAGTMTLPAT